MRPPYSLSSKILKLITEISERIGEINAAHLNLPSTELRKKNRIKTIHSTLEIEGNTLSIEQITAIIENKPVIGSQKDILEVKNAIEVYKEMDKFDPNSFDSFCKAHGVLMKGLIESAGRLRTKAVAIAKGEQITHVTPPIEMLKPLLIDLFDYLKNDEDLVLIKSCVFHYEMEFIHPFMDGNGRMGRLWQTLILKDQYPVFRYLPVEGLIKAKQEQYYNILRKSDNVGHSTFFIEFMLEIMLESLEELLRSQKSKLTSLDRLQIFRELQGNTFFSRKDYLQHFRDISSATASRELKYGVDEGLISRTGDKNTTRYQFI